MEFNQNFARVYQHMSWVCEIAAMNKIITTITNVIVVINYRLIIVLINYILSIVLIIVVLNYILIIVLINYMLIIVVINYILSIVLINYSTNEVYNINYRKKNEMKQNNEKKKLKIKNTKDNVAHVPRYQIGNVAMCHVTFGIFFY
jgi:hypothetical protein